MDFRNAALFFIGLVLGEMQVFAYANNSIQVGVPTIDVAEQTSLSGSTSPFRDIEISGSQENDPKKSKSLAAKFELKSSYEILSQGLVNLEFQAKYLQTKALLDRYRDVVNWHFTSRIIETSTEYMELFRKFMNSSAVAVKAGKSTIKDFANMAKNLNQISQQLSSEKLLLRQLDSSLASWNNSWPKQHSQLRELSWDPLKYKAQILSVSVDAEAWSKKYMADKNKVEEWQARAELAQQKQIFRSFEIEESWDEKERFQKLSLSLRFPWGSSDVSTSIKLLQAQEKKFARQNTESFSSAELSDIKANLLLLIESLVASENLEVALKNRPRFADPLMQMQINETFLNLKLENLKLSQTVYLKWLELCFEAGLLESMATQGKLIL
jgi:hypothetical protein